MVNLFIYLIGVKYDTQEHFTHMMATGDSWQLCCAGMHNQLATETPTPTPTRHARLQG